MGQRPGELLQSAYTVYWVQVGPLQEIIYTGEKHLRAHRGWSRRGYKSGQNGKNWRGEWVFPARL